MLAAEARQEELERHMIEREQQVRNLEAQNTALLDQVQLMGAKQADTSANTSLNLSRYVI